MNIAQLYADWQATLATIGAIVTLSTALGVTCQGFGWTTAARVFQAVGIDLGWIISTFGRSSRAAVMTVSALAISGCALFTAVEPSAASFAVCVANDAARDASISQIVTDCGGDAVAVVVSLLGSSDSRVVGSRAYVEARSLRAALTSSK
jgi:hypothetical protein